MQRIKPVNLFLKSIISRLLEKTDLQLIVIINIIPYKEDNNMEGTTVYNESTLKKSGVEGGSSSEMHVVDFNDSIVPRVSMVVLNNLPARFRAHPSIYEPSASRISCALEVTRTLTTRRSAFLVFYDAAEQKIFHFYFDLYESWIAPTRSICVRIEETGAIIPFKPGEGLAIILLLEPLVRQHPAW
ncbi:MAG: hypothetical protein ABIE03_04735 [Patescibacteria group bacterium]|nr:hypothetical protein [Patescibacteria group bacterium]